MPRKQWFPWSAIFFLIAAAIMISVFILDVNASLHAIGLVAGGLTLTFAGGLTEGGGLAPVFLQSMLVAGILGLVLFVLAIVAWRKKWNSNAATTIAVMCMILVICWWLWFSGWQWAG